LFRILSASGDKTVGKVAYYPLLNILQFRRRRLSEKMLSYTWNVNAFDVMLPIYAFYIEIEPLSLFNGHVFNQSLRICNIEPDDKP